MNHIKKFQKGICKQKVAFSTQNSCYWSMTEHAPNVRDTEKI